MSNTASTPRSRAIVWLSANRNADGSWGFLPGQPGAPEPTVLAAAAGLVDATTLGWLATNELSYAGLLLPAALSAATDPVGLRGVALSRVIETRGETSKSERDIVDIDSQLVGWSWVPGTVAWVEPTAYGIISLKRCGEAAHPRVAQGEALLGDRQCGDGGWNYGNPRVYGTELASELVPTGWATLALGVSADRGFERLSQARTERSTLALSLAVLAHVGRKLDPGEFVGLLVQRQAEDGGFAGRMDWTAMAACALAAAEEGTHAFVV